MDQLKTAAAYIRVSTDEQAELSPESQLSVITQYAEREGYILLPDSIFVDEGVSGRKADKRPAFQRMIAEAKGDACPFETILLWKFSRFARNQEESIFYKSILRSKCGVDVISVSEPLAEGPFGSLIERILEWMDEFYSIRLSEEVKRSMTVNAQKGVLQSTPSFGYCVENRVLVPVPEEAALIREIFDSFNAGVGLFPIAKSLNARGIRTHRGNLFENRTIEYILRNPVYIGKLRWNPSGRSRRDFDNENIIVADGEHEPLITMEQWEAAQKRMAEVKAKWGYKARPTYELKDWISGLVRCSDCSSTLIFSRPHYYKCNNFVRGRCRSSQHIRADLLKESIIERLEQDAAGSAQINYKITYTDKHGGDELNRLQNTRAAVERKIERVRDAYTAGIDSIADYRKYREAADSELAAIDKRIEEIKSLGSTLSLQKDIKTNIKKTLITLSAADASVEQKHEAAKSVIESCIWNKAQNSLTVIYRVIF